MLATELKNGQTDVQKTSDYYQDIAHTKSTRMCNEPCLDGPANAETSYFLKSVDCSFAVVRDFSLPPQHEKHMQFDFEIMSKRLRSESELKF